MTSRWQLAVLAGLVAIAGIAIGVLISQPGDDGEIEVNVSPAVTSDGTRFQGPVRVEDGGRPISDALVRRISRAAGKSTGGGTVIEIERSDDPGEAFEVEVLRSGSEIDVALDQALRRVTNQHFSD